MKTSFTWHGSPLVWPKWLVKTLFILAWPALVIIIWPSITWAEILYEDETKDT